MGEVWDVSDDLAEPEQAPRPDDGGGKPSALRLPRETAAHWLWATGGVASLFLGGLMLMLPHADLVGVVYAIAAYVLLFGVVVLVAAMHFRIVRRGLVPRVFGRQLAP